MNLGINGFGRIGRLVFRAARQNKFEVVGINDITTPSTLAHLLKYDSIHGRFDGAISSDDKNIMVDGRKIPVSAETDPAKLGWGNLGAEIVLECSGKFNTGADAAKHLQVGAKKVLISAPAKGHDGTFIPGINCNKYDK